MKSTKSIAQMMLLGCALPVAAWSMNLPPATDSPTSSPIDAVVRIDPQGHVVAFRSTTKLPADVSSFVYDSLKTWHFRNPPVNGQKLTRPLILHLAMATVARGDGTFDATLSLLSAEAPKQIKNANSGLTPSKPVWGSDPVPMRVPLTVR